MKPRQVYFQEGLCSSVVPAASSSDNASATVSVCFASRTTRFVSVRMVTITAKIAVRPAIFAQKSDRQGVSSVVADLWTAAIVDWH